MSVGKEKIKLGGLTLLNFTSLDGGEAAMVLAWRNAPSVRRWMYSSTPITAAAHRAFIGKLGTDGVNSYWLVKDGAGAACLGVVYLNRISAANRSAFLGIYGNPDSGLPGKGEALMRALRHLAFKVLRLHTLKLEVIADNLRAVRFYKRCGFKREGVLKEYVRRGGKYVDVVIMGLVNEI